MRLQDRLPDCVTVGRKKYRLDLDFRNVLNMLETLGREELLEDAREYQALKCVMRRPPKDTGPVMAAVKGLLFKPAAPESGPKLTSFEQDADLIRAAFLQTYGINLYTERLHWLAFTALLAALPEGSRYTEIVSIRARPMPEATKWNAKEREWLAKAKAQYAVRMTDQEREASYQAGLHQMAMSLLAYAKGGKPNGG